jgi:hypothetical protein
VFEFDAEESGTLDAAVMEPLKAKELFKLKSLRVLG